MQPIFKEQIKMWKDKGYDIPIQEGIYWLDRGIVKAFSKETGNLHNLYKYTVDDDLNINIKQHKDYNKSIQVMFETWKETVSRYDEHLNELENESIELIQKTILQYKDYIFYVLTSTGKDSTVVLALFKKANNNDDDIKIVFNNTSLDCADTYKIVKSHNDWIITNPDEGFYNYIDRMNFIPTRFSRACCGIYKEGNHIKHFNNVDKAVWVMGVRNDESKQRENRKDIDHNPKWGNKDWYSLMPVRKYSDFDIWLYILKYNLEINPKYKKGYSRVGCAIACPYYTKSTWVLDKYWYPTMYKRWHNILHNDFINNQRWCQLNCTEKEYHSCWNGGLLREIPNDEVLNEMMEYKGLLDKNIALNYFNKICHVCNKNVRQKDVIAMNMKMFGRNIEKFKCKKCLMKEFGWTKDDWNRQVEDFKMQGCKLF